MRSPLWTLRCQDMWFAESLRAGFCSQAFSVPIWHIPVLRVQWKTYDGQRNCPKHIEFYSKNKFVKLVYLVGFIIRMFFFSCNPWFGHKVPPHVWIYALKLRLQWSCRTIHAVYLCYDPPCFRWRSCCDGVFCLCGWWCVEMCAFFLTVRRFRLRLWCGFLVDVCFVALLLLSFSCWLHLVYPCWSRSCAAAFREFGMTVLYFLVLRRVRKIAKRDYYVCRVCLLFWPFVRHVRLSAWNNCGPTERIVMKFDMWVFLKALLRMFKFN